MSVVTIHEAKTHLSKLIQRALNGEEIIIAKRDEPMVRLEVIREKKPERRFGGCKDLLISMGDNFDDPMDENGYFEGEFPENSAPDSLMNSNK